MKMTMNKANAIWDSNNQDEILNQIIEEFVDQIKEFSDSKKEKEIPNWIRKCIDEEKILGESIE
jgi:hypothetical protein